MKPYTTLYCIGGGKSLDERMIEHYMHTIDLAREISGATPPKIAVLPTARRNGTLQTLPRGAGVTKEFTKRGCTVNEILIGDVLPGEREMSDGEVNHLLKISDALFVLGGDTRYMLDVIAARCLAPLFINYLESGKLFSGTSAGAIWLAESAMSDSEKFVKPADWRFIMLKGLGVLPFTMTVHDDQGVAGGVSEGVVRREEFERQLLASGNRPGLAIDEFVGLEIRNGQCTVRSPSAEKGAYVLAKDNGSIIRKKIEGIVNLGNPAAVLEYLRG
jgi:peptidase E